MAAFEAGQVSWSTLLREVRTYGLVPIQDLAEFSVELYVRFRRIEAVAHALRETRPEEVVSCCRWAQGHEAEIVKRLAVANALEPKNELEALGKLFIEDKLLWTLRLIKEAFPQWGY